MRAEVAGGPKQEAARPTALPQDLGVNVDAVAWDEAGERRRLERGLDWAREHGIGWVRLRVPWADLEPRRGEVDWSTLDGVADLLADRDLPWVATLETSPTWARQDPAPPPHWMLCRPVEELSPAEARRQPPSDPRDLARFASRLATRYRAGLAAIEIWSEPNLLPHWRLGGPDPEDYARLLVPVAEAIGRAAPGLPRVSAGLAPTREIGVCALSDLVFLDRLARTGALDHVEGVGSLPFGLRQAPGAATGDRGRLGWSRAQAQHRVLEDRGVALPLWGLAWGWRAGEANSPWGGHPPELAAAYTRQAHAQARQDWPWMGPLFLWHLDPAVPEQDPQRGFALLDATGRATALGDAVSAIAGGQPPPPVDRDVSSAPLRGSLSAAVALGLLAFASLVVAAWLGRKRLRSTLLVRRLRVGLDALEGQSDLRMALAYGAFAVLALLAPWPLATGMLALLWLLAVARPAIAVAAVVAVLPFWYGLRLQLGPRVVAPVEGLLAIAIAGRLLRAWLEAPREGSLLARTRAWKVPARTAALLDGVVLGIVLWGALALTWSERLPEAAREWRTVLLEPALLYLLMRAGDPGWRTRVTRLGLFGLLFGATVAAVWALGAVGLHVLGVDAPVVAVQGVLRARGPYASPNNLALLLGRAVAVAGALALLAPTRRLRIVGVTAGAVTLTAWLATFSRGGLLFGLPPTVVALALLGRAALSPRQRDIGQGRSSAQSGSGRPGIGPRTGVALGALALLLLLLAPASRSERLRGALSLEPGSTGYIRLALWRSSWRMAMDHPWLGVGPDQFLHRYAERYVERDVVQERFLSHPHQAGLDWWTRLGAPGISALLLLAWGQARVAVHAWRHGPPRRRWAVAGATAALLYGLGHGMVDNHFFLVDLAAITWLCQAVLLAHVPIASQDRRAPEAQSENRVGPPGFEPGTYRL